MTIVRVKPSARKVDLSEEFDRMFNEFFNGNNRREFNNGKQTKQTPAINVLETGENFVMEIAAPGLQKSDFSINVDEDILTISVDKETGVKETGNFRRREFNYFSFRRNFRLPEFIDTAAIEATYRNGILKLVLPKKEEARELPPRKIEIS